MPASTFDELVSEGMLRAGVEGISTRIGFQLKKWLRSQAQLFLWPQCKRQDNVTLAQGSEEFSVGSGANGVTEEITRILDPMKIFSGSGASVQNYANIRVKTDWDDTLVDNPFTNIGKPDEARLAMSSSNKGEWVVSLNKQTNIPYTVQLEFYVIPVDPLGTAVPWYPNDRTIEQAVYQMALKHNKDPSAVDELKLLAAMVAQDRMAEGIKPGINDEGIKLNPKWFR